MPPKLPPDIAFVFQSIRNHKNNDSAKTTATQEQPNDDDDDDSDHGPPRRLPINIILR